MMRVFVICSALALSLLVTLPPLRATRAASQSGFEPRPAAVPTKSLHLHYPNGIAVDSRGNVYVTVSQPYRTKISPGGKVLRRWIANGDGPGRFETAADVAVDSHDNVYVSDSETDHIQEFSRTGRFLRMWGHQGDRPGPYFDNVTSLVVGRTALYALDQQGSVKVFSFRGRYVSALPFPTNVYPNDIAVDASGSLYSVNENDTVAR